ncbi:MAG: type I 3-dehydroquinate dehydratase [Aigarchaeota archaeon]|nr:type I 3-dehydroquinate dehydratase [Aigarchaeota archaeon]MDW8092263.1 type I 3-dehydroquinate dehydratase [Nitrososphaerota archaeon]
MRSDVLERICLSIRESSVRGFEEKLRRAHDLDPVMVELRLDDLSLDESREALSLASEYPVKVIATIRSVREGGGFRGDDETMIKSLRELSGRADLVDVEYRLCEFDPRIVDHLRSNGAMVIASRHVLTPILKIDQISELAEEMRRVADLVKVVYTATNTVVALGIIDLYAKEWAKGRLISFCMGERWSLTRPLSVILGAPFTYASLDNEPTGPGQLSFTELLHSIEKLMVMPRIAPDRHHR